MHPKSNGSPPSEPLCTELGHCTAHIRCLSIMEWNRSLPSQLMLSGRHSTLGQRHYAYNLEPSQNSPDSGRTVHALRGDGLVAAPRANRRLASVLECSPELLNPRHSRQVVQSLAYKTRLAAELCSRLTVSLTSAEQELSDSCLPSFVIRTSIPAPGQSIHRVEKLTNQPHQLSLYYIAPYYLTTAVIRTFLGSSRTISCHIGTDSNRPCTSKFPRRSTIQKSAQRHALICYQHRFGDVEPCGPNRLPCWWC